MARKGQGYPCLRHDMMMMMMILALLVGFKIHWMYPLQRSKTLHGKKELVSSLCNEIAAPVLKIWAVWGTLLFPLLPGQLWSRLIVTVRVPSMCQVDLYKNYSHSIVRTKKILKKYKYECNHLTTKPEIT